jgi:hypothetical protein
MNKESTLVVGILLYSLFGTMLVERLMRKKRRFEGTTRRPSLELHLTPTVRRQISSVVFCWENDSYCYKMFAENRNKHADSG